MVWARHSGPNLLLIDLVLFSVGTAWQTLGWIAVVLAVVIAVAVGLMLLRLAGVVWKPAVPAGALVCALGLIAAALILIRVVWPPGAHWYVDGSTAPIPLERSVEGVAFWALAAALAIAFGGWRTWREDGGVLAPIGRKPDTQRRSPRHT